MSATFEEPNKRILSNDDLTRWIGSETFEKILGFVVDLQESVEGKTNSTEVEIPPTSKQLLDILNRISEIVDMNPVVVDKNVSRFGKLEFRDFYDQVGAEASKLLEPLVPGKEESVVELKSYFCESWGHRERIDYGSGHELNFVLFLYCLHELGLVGKEEYECLVLKVFTSYIKIMRSLQKTYWLEPAGSHGVWGLDDYHFLPFLFGASQLATHPYMRPKSIHNAELVETYAHEYMYLECINFINNIKTIPNNQGEKLSLRWHSPMLDDISAARSWRKIKEGMVKMYRAEVMSKLPIMQHLMFGSIVKCPEGISEASEHNTDECGHVHDQTAINTWGDCCGIKIPSAIAASESLKISENGKARLVPFD